MAGGDIKSSISAMLPTNEPFVASNTSSVYNDSGMSNTPVGMEEEKFQQMNSSLIGLLVTFHSTVAAVIFIGNLVVLIVTSKRKDLQVRMLQCFISNVLCDTLMCDLTGLLL